MFFVLLILMAPDDVFTRTLNEPLAAEDWAVKTDPARRMIDAVVLQDATRLSQTFTRRYRRVRILSLEGRSAVSLVDEAGLITDLIGRVVTPNGTTTNFSIDDMESTLGYRTRREEHRIRMLLPPGLTDDCVVEMLWKQTADQGLPPDTLLDVLMVQEPFYVVEKVFKISGNMGMRYVYKAPADPARFEKTYLGQDVLTFRNFPPFQSFPFSNVFDQGDLAFVTCYAELPGQPGGIDVWPWLRTYVHERLFPEPAKRQAKAYKTWIKDMKASLPAAPEAALFELTRRFRARISPREAQADQESPAKPLSIDDPSFEAKVLDRGYGTDYERCRLFLRTALDCGLPVQLVYPNADPNPHLQPFHGIPFCFDFYRPYFGLEVGGALHLTAVHLPAYPIGSFDVDLEGTRAFFIDPVAARSQFKVLPTRPYETHSWTVTAHTELSRTGEARMRLEQQLTGTFSAHRRAVYLDLMQDEQVAWLIRDWHERLPDWEVESGALTLDETMTESLTARGTCITTANTLILNAVPYGLRPLPLPRLWPPERNIPIALPRTGRFREVHHLTVPAGMHLKGFQPLSAHNDIGSVVLTATQEGRTVTVERLIDLPKAHHEAFKEPDVKQFVSWMARTESQKLVLTDGGAP